MDLIRTQRVRFLTEIYKDLQKPLAKGKRLELLKKVQKILLDESCFPDFPEVCKNTNFVFIVICLLFFNAAF